MPPLTPDIYKALIAEHEALLERAGQYYSHYYGHMCQQDSPELFDFTEKHSVDLSNFIASNARRLCQTGSVNPMYLITFTHNQTTDKAIFRAAVIKQLNRSIFLQVRFAEEHKDTNYHLHAICTSKFNLNKDNFKSHARKYGHVDVRHVTKDNGLDEYISKESEIIILRQ